VPTRTVLASNRAVLAPEPRARLSAPTKPPSFSVVIAAYQVAPVIADAIASVLGQTVAPIEVIVVDDGSTDDLEGAIRDFASNVRLERREHAGAAATMNAGARIATGDYVCFIGADDVFAPERLAALTELAVARPDLDVLTTDAWIAADGRVFRRFNDETLPFETADQRHTILERNFVFGHTAVRRERFLEVAGFDESIRWTSDWELWARLILGGSTIGSVDEPLATYRLNEGSLSAKRLQQARGRLMSSERMLAHPSLSDAERQFVRGRIALIKREIDWGDAMQACIEGADDRRGRAARVLRDSGQPPLIRAQALLAAAAPALSRAVLRRVRARYWVGAGGKRVRRAT
jgi:Glycosyl transferase family 2